MICLIRDIPVYYEEHGEGKPVLNIHGFGPDHRSMSGGFEPVFEQMQGYRRIYLDLPGFGRTPTAPWIQNSDHVIEILCEFIDSVIGAENFLLTGYSWGGYLSLGLICKMSNRIDGVFFLTPLTDSYAALLDKPGNLPQHQIMWQSDQLDLSEITPSLEAYMSMAVIAKPELFEEWQKHIWPGIELADTNVISNLSIIDYTPQMEEAIRTITFDKPCSIINGRQDQSTGYIKPYELVERFSRATFVALDCAGHIPAIDNEPLFQQLVKDWIWRVELG